MTISRPIVFVELNEVPFRIIDRYCKDFPHSALARLMAGSFQFTTMCEDKTELDPWISWPTLHRGVNDAQHGIFRLGQPLEAIDQRWPPIWRILADAGRSVGVFGSLHSSNVPENVADYAFYIPDFFDDGLFAHPDYLEPFQAFNVGMTSRSARNVDMGIPLGLALGFLRSFPRLGLRAQTLEAIFRQLIMERREPRLRLRRRSLQALMMADVFVRQLKRGKPAFASFYTNHVAAAMHRYWAALYPEDYAELPVTLDWMGIYKDEIVEAMHVFDAMLEPLVRHCEATQSRLVIASSMGQAAIDRRREVAFATIRDINKFMRILGFLPGEYQIRKAMVPSFGVIVDPARVEELADKLDQVSVGGEAFVRNEIEILPFSYFVGEDGFLSILSCYNGYEGPHEVDVSGVKISFEESGFAMVPHEDGVSVTAHHVPEGALLVFDPLKRPSGAERGTISTCDIAPAIIADLGVEVPVGMRRPRGDIF